MIETIPPPVEIVKPHKPEKTARLAKPFIIKKKEPHLNNEVLTKYLSFIEKKLGTVDPRPGVEENIFYYDQKLR